MSIFRNAVFVAALAGLCAGVVMTALQSYATVPLILEAESFETAAPEAAAVADPAHAVGTAAHDHGEAWAPADGLERTAYTALSNIVTGIGFAMLLVAISEIAGGIASWRQGIFWGFAGFAVFTLAPGLGLPPELPAMPAAELTARQIWWIATVIGTAGGLALIAFRQSPLLALLGVSLIVAPHIVGAPQPVSHDSPIPDSLHHRFVVAVTVTSLMFWLVLGAAVGFLRTRFVQDAAHPQGKFA